MASVDHVPAAKVAFQASRRFWELDQQIYGGVSWTSRDATRIWYPSGGLQQEKGILVGAYIRSDDLGNAFAAKPLAQRLSDTLGDVAQLHPDAPRWLGDGVSVAWKNVPYARGGWAEWSRSARATQFPSLLRGGGPVSCSPASTCRSSPVGRKAPCGTRTRSWGISTSGCGEVCKVRDCTRRGGARMDAVPTCCSGFVVLGLDRRIRSGTGAHGDALVKLGNDGRGMA